MRAMRFYARSRMNWRVACAKMRGGRHRPPRRRPGRNHPVSPRARRRRRRTGRNGGGHDARRMRLLRPLLGVPKAALEAVCVAAGHPFVRDPSNENMRFARTRLRALGELLSSQGLDAKALARLGERAARADAALDWCAARASPAAAASRDEAMTKLNSTALRELPLEILRRLLAAEIHARGSAAPRLDRLERAAEFVALGLREGVEGRITLAGLSIRANNREVTLTAAPPRFRGRGKPRAAPAKVLNDL